MKVEEDDLARWLRLHLLLQLQSLGVGETHFLVPNDCARLSAAGLANARADAGTCKLIAGIDPGYQMN